MRITLRSLCLTGFILLMPARSALGQCQIPNHLGPPSSLDAGLGDFVSFLSSSSSSMQEARATCRFVTEPSHMLPARYLSCPNSGYQDQAALSRIGIVAGLEISAAGPRANEAGGIDRNSLQARLTGSDLADVGESLRYHSGDNGRTSSELAHGIDLWLLGAKLRLPGQVFAVISDPPPPEILASTGAQGHSMSWTWVNRQLNVGRSDRPLSFPISGLGDLQLWVSNTNSAPNAVVTSHAPTYQAFVDRPTADDADWSWYAGQNPSGWAPLQLSSSWQLGLLTPPVGYDLGPVEASLRGIISLQATGEFHHRDLSKVTIGGDYEGTITTADTVTIAGSVSGGIRATIRLGWASWHEDWTLETPQTSQPSGWNAAAADWFVKDVPLIKCEASPNSPPLPRWVPDPRSPAPSNTDANPSLTAFGTDVHDRVAASYVICDGGKKYDPQNDIRLKQLIESLRGAGTKERCDKLTAYLRTHLYICKIVVRGGTSGLVAASLTRGRPVCETQRG